MGDGHAAAHAVFVGQAADEVEIHVVRHIAEVDVQIDIGIIALRQFEDAAELSRPIGVGARRSADDPDPALESRDQELVGFRTIGEALFGKYADLDIDQRGEVAYGAPNAFEPAQIDDRIELDMGAHPRRAFGDRALQHAPGAGVDILDGEAALHLARASNGIGEPPRLGSGAVEHAGFVEMDMAFDQAAAGKTAAEVALGGVGRKARLDGDYSPVRDADVHEAGLARQAGKACIA